MDKDQIIEALKGIEHSQKSTNSLRLVKKIQRIRCCCCCMLRKGCRWCCC